MPHLVGLMISIGLADSLNPSTIAPALYLAASEHPRRRVAEFTVAVFLVYLLGGALIALGPGQLIRSLAPHRPGQQIKRTAWRDDHGGRAPHRLSILRGDRRGPGGGPACGPRVWS